MDVHVRPDQQAFAARPETTGNITGATPMNGRRVHRLAQGRARGLHLRRAGQGRHHPSRLPQHRAHDRAALRRAARSEAQGQDPDADRHRQWRHDARLFQGAETMDDLLQGREAIAEWARLTYGWVGRAPDYKAAFLATLGANADFYDPYQDNAKRWYRYSQERVPFINHAIIHPPVDRDRPPNEVADVCCPCREGDRCRDHRLGRQGGGDRVGAHQLHLRRPPRPDPGAGQELRHRLHAADQFAGREVHLPHLLRDDGDGDGQPVRLSALLAPRRERRRLHHGQGAGPLGERLRLWRHREGQQLLPAHRLPAALRRAWLHAARGQARLHRRAPAEGGRGGGHQGLSRRPGQCRRGHRLAEPVLGPVGRDGARSEAVDRRLRAPQHGSRQRLPDHRHHGLYQGQIPDRADRRLGPDLPEQPCDGLQEPGDPALSRPLSCAAPTATRPRSG